VQGQGGHVITLEKKKSVRGLLGPVPPKNEKQAAVKRGKKNVGPKDGSLVAGWTSSESGKKRM